MQNSPYRQATYGAWSYHKFLHNSVRQTDHCGYIWNRQNTHKSSNKWIYQVNHQLQEWRPSVATPATSEHAKTLHETICDMAITITSYIQPAIRELYEQDSNHEPSSGHTLLQCRTSPTPTYVHADKSANCSIKARLKFAIKQAPPGCGESISTTLAWKVIRGCKWHWVGVSE